MPNLRLLSVSVFFMAIVPSLAFASDPTAEALYQEGRRAAQQKDWDLACKKFKDSHDREPAPGTLLNLGDCEEKRGKLVAAQGHFAAAARLFKLGDERAMYARQRGAAIERRMPKLTLRVHPSSPVGTSIERDGVPLEAATLNVPVAIDPGEHVILVRAPGRLDVRSTVRLADSETREIELTAGAPAPSATVAAKPSEPVAAAPKPAPKTATHVVTTAVLAEPAPAEAPASSSPLKTIGFVTIGVGTLALGAGVLGAVKTLDAKHTTDAHCNAVMCDAVGAQASADGKQWSSIGTAGFVIGGIGVATGAALVIFAPKSSSPARPERSGTMAIEAGPGALRLSGSF